MTDANDRSRRRFLSGVGTAATGGLATALAERSLAQPVRAAPGEAARTERVDADADAVFPQSVASGDPAETGVILWTRVAPEHYHPDAPLRVEVAADEAFARRVHDGTVPVRPDDDYTVQVTLDGELEPGETYHYRFSYRGVRSRTGRCRTLPAADASPDAVSFAVLTCQDYANGYYPAYHYVAEEDVDFLLHLGDFIYEAVDGRFKGPGSRSYEGRDVELPSGAPVAQDLADFRHLYEVYRSDRFLQEALERHTLVAGWDDHEVANNRYWDDEAGAARAPGRGEITELTADGIQAWVEWLPSRVGYDPDDPDDPDLLEAFDLGRTFAFGDLVDLVLTDERLYRDGPPECPGPGQSPTCDDPGDGNTTRETSEADRSMLGDDQREWFLGEVRGSEATWTTWANEVLTMALKGGEREAALHVNNDAWDGYEAERKAVMRAVRDADVDNFVTLTGDMHSYVAGYQQVHYERPTEDPSTSPVADEENRVGVEFMTPAVTSVNVAELHPGPEDERQAAATESMAEAGNRHIEFFDSSRWGYSVVEFTPDDCTYTAYAVDKTENSPDASREVVQELRVPEGEVDIRGAGTGPEQVRDETPPTR